ncbi:MAG: acyltransferase, partial [Mycoplasmatota bacterium]|nr:acyltransferase [Mycoplasmatota bacterium]
MKQFIAKGELVMKNVFIDRMNEKDVERFTSDFGLRVRRMTDKGFKKACNVFTGANILRDNSSVGMSDDDYFASLSLERIPLSNYDIQPGKNNIILERYPQLLNDESYIFVCNHTCPEDIETVLNV